MFDCCAEPGGAGLCLLSCCCPCIVVGQLAENMPAGSWCGPLAGNCCLAGTCYCCLPAAGSAAVMIASWAGIVGYMNGTLSAAASTKESTPPAGSQVRWKGKSTDVNPPPFASRHPECQTTPQLHRPWKQQNTAHVLLLRQGRAPEWSLSLL